ncbi:MAG: DUF2339 domain-containing protein [Acidobacteriota bacterium]|nr:DUF2339 domain-containing protein [Acidobacteriota bacterium]
MDDVAAILFVAGLIILGPWVFVIVMGVRRKRERRESEARLATLTQRIYVLEQRFKEAVQRGGVAPAAPAPAEARTGPAVVPPPPPAITPVVVVPAARPEPQQQPWPKPAESPYSPRTTPATTTPPAAPAPRKRSGIEELIAGNWLVFIGIALLVFGIAFGLSVFWERLGPAGKVAIGLLSGLVLLASGVWLEKKDARYKLFARAGIGGGWAVLFFTTYAMYHLPATQIITSQALDLGLLLLVAAAMVGHTLRYNSQVVTGVAFLLAFSTVTISHVNVYSLGASAILALALAAIVVRRRWFELEVFGILASYLNHWWWLHSIIEPMNGNKYMFPEFFPSAAILVLYWAAYRASYVLRTIDLHSNEHEMEERVSTVAAILNTALLLFVLKYQSITPKYAFYALLVLGALELMLGLVMRGRERRAGFVVLATMGASLLTAAFPFKFSGGELSVIWLLVAEMFYLTGVFTDELLFRRFGRLAEIVVAVQLYVSHPLDAPKSWHNATVFILAAVLFGANSHLVPWRWPKIFETRWERFGARLISWLGVLLAMTAIWLALPEAWNAVGWAALAFWLAFAGYTLAQKELSYQANVVAIAATIGTLIMNLPDESIWHGVSLRLVTVSIVALLLYGTARFAMTPRLRTPSDAGVSAFQLRPIYTWSAALLITVLAADELTEAWIAPVWALFALALAFLGQRQKLKDFVLQANVLSVLAFIWTLVVTTTHGEPLRFGITVRLASTAIVIAALYTQTLWSEIADWPWTRGLSMVHAWAASFLVGWLMWYELLPVSVAVGWALFALALLELGLARPASNKQWRAQAYVAMVAAFLRIFFVNLNAEGLPGEISARVYTTVPIALLLFYCYSRLESAAELEPKETSRRASALFAWMGTISVVALIRFELPLDWVVAVWAAVVGVLLAVAWTTGRRTFTAQGLLLLVPIVFRASMHNFAQRSYFASLSWEQRWLPVATTVALLFAALYPAFRLQESAQAAPPASGIRRWAGALMRRPEQPVFFAAIGLLTVLLYLETAHALVTVAWGIEAVAVFVFALLVRERSFRLTGLALLLAAIGKIVIFDIWSFTGGQKFVTFMVLGIVTIAISLLYTRYKDALKEYL